MENLPEVDPAKETRRKDIRFACTMLVIYAVCFLAFVVGTFVWVREDRNAARADAAATEGAAATQQVEVIATSVARSTEQAQYDYVEGFEDTSARWFVGNLDNEYGTYTASIEDGVYKWDIVDSNEYSQGADFYQGSSIRDFDAYVDVKFERTEGLGSICSGLVFRKSSLDWEDGAYVFNICNDAHFEVFYYDRNGWQSITYSSDTDGIIHPADWNRLGVSASDHHFSLTINNVPVFEKTDDRRDSGGLGLYIIVGDDTPAEIWFDNFGFQRR